jgi:hypothetical protein
MRTLYPLHCSMKRFISICTIIYGTQQYYILVHIVNVASYISWIKTDRLTRNQDNVFELSHMFTTDSCFSKLTLCIDNIHTCLWWKQQLNYLKIAETSVVLNVSNGGASTLSITPQYEAVYFYLYNNTRDPAILYTSTYCKCGFLYQLRATVRGRW